MASLEIEIKITAPSGSGKEAIFLAALNKVEEKYNVLDCKSIYVKETETHLLSVEKNEHSTTSKET